MFVIYNDKDIDEVMAQQTGIVTPVRKRKTVEGNSSAHNVIKLISIFVWLDFIYRGLTIFF